MIVLMQFDEPATGFISYWLTTKEGHTRKEKSVVTDHVRQGKK